MSGTAAGALAPYRVLDLTNERGLLCGQILGDLGADVVQIEPPGGSSARRQGPFFGADPHPDRSLFWWSYARNKRSVVLDLDAAEGRALFLRLAAHADFVVESDEPGVQAARGLGYADLAAVNPALVYVSISPFGQTGPRAHAAATDLTLMAASGPLVLTGDEDRPPVRVTVPQAFLHAAAEAAGAALVANHERQRSGRGQHVDVSAQQSVALATQSMLLAGAMGAFGSNRVAGGGRFGPIRVRFVWPAADGYVSITHLFGGTFARYTRRLMEYVHDEGGCDAATRDKDWARYFELLFTGGEPMSEYERVVGLLEAFTRSKTKAELFHAARERELLIAPVATIEEVLASEQLAARDYWQPVAHPELGRTFVCPGPFARMSATPITYRRRPPTLGEHTREVLAGDLGVGAEALDALAARGVIG